MNGYPDIKYLKKTFDLGMENHRPKIVKTFWQAFPRWTPYKRTLREAKAKPNPPPSNIDFKIEDWGKVDFSDWGSIKDLIAGNGSQDNNALRIPSDCETGTAAGNWEGEWLF